MSQASTIIGRFEDAERLARHAEELRAFLAPTEAKLLALKKGSLNFLPIK